MMPSETEDYARFNQTDPRIAAQVWEALGDARTVLNIGAGTGSYEPADRNVTAVEPDPAMRAARPQHLSKAIDAAAEALPFADKSFDAAMAIFTVHLWHDLEKGLREMRRVTHGPAIVLTANPDDVHCFWLAHYAPELMTERSKAFPPLATIVCALGTVCDIVPVLIPQDCCDGFNEAFYGRPEMLLNSKIRRGCASWRAIDHEATTRFERRLRSDLASGAWDAKYGALRTQPTFIGSTVLLISHP
jgi:SAM-dependent methyltransferase